MEALLQLQNDPTLMMNALAFVCGLVVHILQKMFENEISFKEYLTQHGGRTMFSFGGLATAFCSIQFMYPEASYLAYFVSAYMMDNFANKVPMSQNKADELTVK